MEAGEMRKGVFYAVGAYLAWGLLPLYWKVFQEMAAWEILAHRIVWSLVFVAVLLFVTKRWLQMRKAISTAKERGALLLCSLFISANWLIFIWAVNNGNVLETSLGYYINPLLNVLFGVLFLKERLGKGQWMAIALAAAGVSVMTAHYGRVPWVAISLALTFACYGLVKKLIKTDAIISLAWETLVVAPVALGYLVTLHVSGTDTLSHVTGWQIALLTLSGVATALPLFWFAQAAKLLPLSTVGFIQYLAPSISLFMAVFLFGEAFGGVHLVSFGLIWSALFVYTVSSMRKKPGSAQQPVELAIKKEA
jgi:chloramphenicol-sensitive protein RarD